jgi:hypothetical protein
MTGLRTLGQTEHHGGYGEVEQESRGVHDRGDQGRARDGRVELHSAQDERQERADHVCRQDYRYHGEIDDEADLGAAAEQTKRRRGEPERQSKGRAHGELLGQSPAPLSELEVPCGDGPDH